MNNVIARLISDGLLDESKAKQVTDAYAQGKPLDDALRQADGAAEDKILRSLGAYFDVPFVDLEKDGEKYAPPKELLAKFPASILLERRLMPIAANGHAPHDGDAVSVVTSRDLRYIRAGRAAPGDGAGRASGPGPLGGDRPIHQEIPGRRRRHAAIDGGRGRRRQGAGGGRATLIWTSRMLLTMRRSSSLSTRSWPKRWSCAPRTCTSSRSRTSCASAIASTACCRKPIFRRRCANIRRRSCRA